MATYYDLTQTGAQVQTILDNALDADHVVYDNTNSGLSAANVQDAIDELNTDISSISLTASNVTYDNTSSGLSSTNVQNAIDEVVDDTTDEFYFKAGESYSFSGALYLSCGFITTGQKEIFFPIYLPKRTDNVTSASLTVSKASIRHVGGGYLLQGGQLTSLGTVTVQMGTCFLTVKVASSSALSATNNTPVVVELTSAVVTFS